MPVACATHNFANLVSGSCGHEVTCLTVLCPVVNNLLNLKLHFCPVSMELFNLHCFVLCLTVLHLLNIQLCYLLWPWNYMQPYSVLSQLDQLNLHQLYSALQPRSYWTYSYILFRGHEVTKFTVVLGPVATKFMNLQLHSVLWPWSYWHHKFTRTCGH